MAKQSTFEDIVDLVGKLPWWVGLFGAILIYFLLHLVAIQEVPQPKSIDDMASSASSQMLRTLAYIGQYVLSLAFLIGAIVSLFSLYKRKLLIEGVRGSQAKDSLLDMSWKEFEMLVGEAFRREGYNVKETQEGADGGVDLVLNKDGAKTLVQCKQWRSSKVGVSVVRELYGVMAASKASHGIVVTSGYFTQEAMAFAEGKSIQLIAGDELFRMIKTSKKAANNTVKAPLQSDIPTCPLCDSTMVLRTAKKGPNAGSQFWGCSEFPQCRGIRNLD